MTAIRTTEIPPPGAQPLAWTLLTIVPTERLEAACERLDEITEMFRVMLKVIHAGRALP